MMPKFDFHTHTSYSDGNMSALDIVEAAEARELEAVAITDHAPEHPNGIPPQKIDRMISDIELARRDSRIPVLRGIEANIIDLGGMIDLDERLQKRFDLLVVGIHKSLSATRGHAELARSHLNSIMNAIDRQRIDIIAHPFASFHGDLADYLTPTEVDAFTKLAAQRGVAVEINMRYRIPSEEFLKACLNKGIKISIASDAHTVPEVGKIDWAMARLRRVGARREDLILDKFLSRA